MRNIDWFPLSRQAGTRHCLQLGVVMKRKFSSSENSRPSPDLSNVLINSWPFPGLENSISNSRTFPEFPTAWQPWIMECRNFCTTRPTEISRFPRHEKAHPCNRIGLIKMLMTKTITKTNVDCTVKQQVGILRNNNLIVFLSRVHRNKRKVGSLSLSTRWKISNRC